MISKNRLAQAASYYAKHYAWHVIPLHGIVDGRCTCNVACPSPGKHPIGKLVPHGEKDASVDPTVIGLWWKKYPSANIGIALLPSKLIVIDIDERNGGYDSLRDLERNHGPLPRTLSAKTGNGEHFYFQSEPDLITASPRPGIDVKRNGYVVAPPSNHWSGRVYGWDNHPTKFDEAPLPDFLKDLVSEKQKTTRFTLPDQIKSGERNSTLFSLASSLRSTEATEDEIFVALKTINGTRSQSNGMQDPVPSDEEIRGIASRACKFPQGKTIEPSSGVVVRISDIVRRDIQWLIRPYIPIGKVTMLEGDPDVGKSFITLSLAAAVSLGNPILGSPSTEARNVLLFGVEDDLEDTVKARLSLLGADETRVFVFTKGFIFFNENGFQRIENEILEKKPALVCFDPLTGFAPPKVDIYRANHTRPIFARLARIAADTGCAILIVRHLRKGASDKAIYRGGGSIDITGACRSVLLAGCDPQDKENRAVIHIKSNLSAKGDPWGYSIKNGVFEWSGRSNLTASKILGAETNSGNEAPQLREAKEFLEEMLSTGPLDAECVKGAAQQRGISLTTLQRAKKELGVVALQKRLPGAKEISGWQWSLLLQDRQDYHICANGDLEGVQSEPITTGPEAPTHV